MPTATEPQAEWITNQEAAKILGVSIWSFPRIARLKGLTIRDLPVRTKYRRDEVERLAQTCIGASESTESEAE